MQNKGKQSILEKIKRPVDPKLFIKEIDGLRFLAILTVFMLHLNNYVSRSVGRNFNAGISDFFSWDWFINRFGFGVEIFFAISGFVISLPLLRHYMYHEKKTELKVYYRRRFSRIGWPFLLSCVIFYTLYVVANRLSLAGESPHLFSAVAYVHTLIYGAWAPFNPVTWSLEAEVQFYLIAPFLIGFIFSNHSLMLVKLLGLAAAAIVVRALFLDDIARLHLDRTVFVFLPLFLSGFLLAFIYLRHNDFLLRKSYVWDAVAAAVFFGMLWTTYAPNRTAFTVCCFVFLVAVFKSRLLNRMLTHKAVYVLGGMSYSFYLLHYPMFYLFGKVFGQHLMWSESYVANYFTHALVFFPLTILVASVFYWVVERPCIARKRNVRLRAANGFAGKLNVN